MKKIMILLLTFIVILCFSSQVNGKSTDRYIIEKPAPDSYKAFTAENAGEKQANFPWLKQQMEKMKAKCSASFKRVARDTPFAGELKILPNTVNIQPDADGYTYITGLCQNVNEPQATLIFISFEFFDASPNSLGTALGMAFGESNIRVPTDDGILCLNAMHPGEKGFFVAHATDVKYDDVDSYTAAFYYGVPIGDTLPLANAQLSIESIDKQTWGSNLLKAHVTVKNSSANYASVTTIVAMGVFDTTNTKVIDVSANYAGGTSVPGYNWAVYPLDTETVDLIYMYVTPAAVGTAYRPSFIFYEGEADPSSDTAPPFGSFDTPVDGSTVSGSIAVTGWALDDFCLKSLKIYRKEGTGMVYVGDANFLEGARPDIEAAYPTYPNCSKAGWGYMLLTNFLPNGGNGTFTLYAVAADRTGKSTTLGEKTIICDNAHAVKPFGAIDTPTQGGIAVGSNFINWGWVLTPPSDYIKTDGTEIFVYVDGTKLSGHVNYNKKRDDIEAAFAGGGYLNLAGTVPLFPGVVGPGGNYVIDTTNYEDGTHTIQWYARDSGGDSDGIGSRYFNITNGDDDASHAASAAPANKAVLKPAELEKFPANDRDTILIKKGFRDHVPGTLQTAEQGIYRIDMKEMGRIQIAVSNNNNNPVIAGYQIIGDQLRKLPIGSTLDRELGIFSWMPGPGFIGEYRLVFIEVGPSGERVRKDIIVNIVPGAMPGRL